MEVPGVEVLVVEVGVLVEEELEEELEVELEVGLVQELVVEQVQEPELVQVQEEEQGQEVQEMVVPPIVCTLDFRVLCSPSALYSFFQ